MHIQAAQIEVRVRETILRPCQHASIDLGVAVGCICSFVHPGAKDPQALLGEGLGYRGPERAEASSSSGPGDPFSDIAPHS